MKYKKKKEEKTGNTHGAMSLFPVDMQNGTACSHYLHFYIKKMQTNILK